MDRYCILALTMLCATNCCPELPLEYWISISCQSNSDADLIKIGAESWNEAACANVVNYQGVLNDKTFDLDDLQDSRLTIYCIDDIETKNHIIANISNDKIIGLALGDIIIKTKSLLLLAQTYLKREKNKKSLDYYYGKLLKSTLAHELGHKLGRNDIYNPQYPTIMNGWLDLQIPERPTKFDIFGSEDANGLCDDVNCPPKEQCPTAPL